MGPAAPFLRERVFPLELRAEAGASMPTMAGHFAVWDQWTEINSIREGRFLERFAPSSMNATISRDRGQMKVMYEHGHDPTVGQKLLGSITSLQPDAVGAAYRVQLFDTSYVRDLLPALEAGALGASMRFQVVFEEFVAKPGKSDFNPLGLPLRTVTESRVREFGPVVWGAYKSASASVQTSAPTPQPATQEGPAWKL